MNKKKSALQKLAFKIAEDVVSQLTVLVDDVAPATEEEVYQIIYQNMPFDMEAVAEAEEEFLKFISGPPQPERSSPMSNLRKALHCDAKTPIKVVIEAAIKAIEERDMLSKKERHGCTGMWCEECQPIIGGQ